MACLNSHPSTRGRLRLSLALVAIGLVATTTVPVFAGSPGTWTTTGNLNTARASHTATLLPNGQVLVAGGIVGIDSNFQPIFTATAEIYNPTTGQWRTTGSMTVPRANHGAVLLQNGQVLAAGSAGVSAELYDPSKGTWKTTGSMNYARSWAQITLLQNGQVLIAAGSSTSPAQETAELFSNGHWSLTSNLYFCCYHNNDNAVLLTNGDVVIYGSGNLPSYASEFYDPSTNVWQRTFGQNYGNLRIGPLALLTSGKVLLGGGAPKYGKASSASMLYDPSTNYWTLTGSLNQPRSSHTLTRLSNGQVLAAGGSGISGLLSSAELYAP